MFGPDPVSLALAVALKLAPTFDIAHLAESKPGFIVSVAKLSQPSYRPQGRAVTNWRFEALNHLERPLELAPRVFAAPGRDDLPRCIRLNNYWCIKRAGWSGEIASDNEGHVAFASAREGAIVAARLLKRYYLDFGRHDAQAIISHWAPAQCGGLAWRAPSRPALASARTRVASATPARTRVASIAPAHTPVAPTRHRLASLDVALNALARHMVGNNLRARWLAAHHYAGMPHPVAHAPRVAIRQRPAPQAHVARKSIPSIMEGGSDISLEPVTLASVRSLDALLAPNFQQGHVVPSPNLMPGHACVGDAQRIRNYVAHAIAGIVQHPNDDLQLFASDGTPGANLAPLMLNMAKVEIGPFAARPDLVREAIAAAFPPKTDATARTP